MITQRIAEASRLGYSRILVPQGTRERLDSKVSGIIEVGTLSAALNSR
jgi:predicted ATP-dependent serine protease